MHVEEEDLEQYAMGRVPSVVLRDLEMHLLVYHRCQDRLAETDLFLAAMREACREVRVADRAGLDE
jgi:hypothetical protein